MPEEKGSSSPLFLDDKSIRDILEQATKSLLISPSEEIVEEAFKLINSMKKDLIRISQLPLDNAEPFKSHDSLTLEEIDNFYKKQVSQEENKSFSTPHTIN
ncbi:hypothetical protein OVS_02930 [Mycoplasma ovis str. Michigan]|uniref:Glutamyl-tRNA amidotransferase n=1 Tax=Mycoplasma ovis str. Michigan TaxID=1415773 RepID=A0ABM5P106_9MOLU|nr:hypothetical protein [Mycoplasma ovis]AHC40006.1 hypothetical protein OVS_02930 [Mycoplasma ovis str. Michigan]